MDQTFVFSEETAARLVSQHLSQAADGLAQVSLAVAGAKPQRVNLAGTPPVLLLVEVTTRAGRVISTAGSGSKAAEAAEKAKAWSIVGAVFAVVAAVVIVVIAIVMTVFTFGAGAPAAVAVSVATIGATAAVVNSALVVSALTAAITHLLQAGDAIRSLMTAAQRLQHPIAGRFGAAIGRLTEALRQVPVSGKDASAPEAALRTIQQTLQDIEGLTIEARSLPGPCFGHPTAVFRSAQDGGMLMDRMSQVVQTMAILREAEAEKTTQTFAAAGTTAKSVRPATTTPRTA